MSYHFYGEPTFPKHFPFCNRLIIMESPISFASINPEDLQVPLEVSVSPQTGAANIQVGIPVSPGRDGFAPVLSLGYSSSGKNSIIGCGWGLSGVPQIGVFLKDGFPKYDVNQKYSFNGQEIVPWLDASTTENKPRIERTPEYLIEYFRARQEGTFNRIEKWTKLDTQAVHWRVRTPDNETLIFGLNIDGKSKISDPRNPERIFVWLLEAHYDKSGNAIWYEYLQENRINVDVNQLSEYHRNSDSGLELPQRYLKRIKYGNTKPISPEQPNAKNQHWCFEVKLDYGEHSNSSNSSLEQSPTYQELHTWPTRPDPYSTYMPGFEVRNYRLLRGVLMYHNFPKELGEEHTLIGHMELVHNLHPAGSTLEGIEYSKYRINQGEIERKRLPRIRFNYTQADVARAFRPSPSSTNENVPLGIGGINYKWVDLYGEGLPGILYESNQAWYYKPNLGNGNLGRQTPISN